MGKYSERLVVLSVERHTMLGLKAAFVCRLLNLSNSVLK